LFSYYAVELYLDLIRYLPRQKDRRKRLGIKMNPSKKTNPERDHVGPKETGGMTSAVKTPATSGLGVEVPKVFDAKGTIGKQFTGR